MIQLKKLKDTNEYARDPKSRALLSTNKQALLGSRKRAKLQRENRTLKDRINTLESRLDSLEQLILTGKAYGNDNR